jgi:enoyl-[acyl-carrier protein] reductase II
VPVLVVSQGGPKAHLKRFHNRGVKWLHVVASPGHAQKAEEAGVDAVVAVGGDAGGHPAPDEVSAMVMVRAVVKAVRLPVVAAGGVADGAGVAAMLALGAEAVQLGTRFLMTPEANVHAAYKQAVRVAGIADTTLIGRGRLPVRGLKNAFSAEVELAERSGMAEEELKLLIARSTLKMAAFDGDIAQGKVEAGQSAGLIDDIVPAGEVVENLMCEFAEARSRLVRLD